MTIQFRNGEKMEAIILAETEYTMRVAIRGTEDNAELTKVNEDWTFEGSEPVKIEFAWQKRTRQEIIDEANCVCSRDLASRLIDKLLGKQIPTAPGTTLRQMVA